MHLNQTPATPEMTRSADLLHAYHSGQEAAAANASATLETDTAFAGDAEARDQYERGFKGQPMGDGAKAHQ